MAYSNPQMQEIEVLEIYPQTTSILAKMNGEEGELKLASHVKFEFVKVGPAVIKLDGYNQIVFLKMKSSNNQPVRPKSFGFAKPNTNGSPSGFKKSYGQPNQFKREAPFHYVTERKILEKVTLNTFNATCTALETQGIWVFATQLFPRMAEQIEDKTDKTLMHNYYDAVIFIKTKVDGARVNPESSEEDGPFDSY